MSGVGPLNPRSIGLAPAPAPGTAGPASGTTGQAGNSAAAQWPDQPDIRVLDVPAALQILLFEVSDALGLEQSATPAQSADQAAGVIIDGFLRKLAGADPVQPEDPAGLAWARTADQVQIALVSGMDRAIGIVSAWRAVTAEVTASIAASREIVTAALVDEPAPKFLTRPEWLGLAPRIERYRRRRRALRRLQDPDYEPAL